MRPSFAREKALGGLVAGVDEAGRGPLAGPVVAAAVILPARGIPRGIDDSKKLTEPQREALYAKITARAVWAVGSASTAEIDEINIFWATMLAMERAVAALAAAPTMVLVDGNCAPQWSHPTETVVGGDSTCLSIAAASVVAKVTRDREMRRLALQHPEYGWERNKGYSTAEHLSAVERLGPCVHHRRSFKRVSPFGHTTSSSGEGPARAPTDWALEEL
jgi:ribonuclease HII